VSEAKKIIIPKATLTEPCKKSDEGATSWDGNKLLSPGEQFFDRPVARKIKYGKRTGTYSWNLFPVVVDGNAALWPEASLYILDRIMGIVGPSMSTYHSIADDLAAYKRWLEDEEVDFKHFPANKLERPTYRYRGDLMLKARAGEIAIGSASRMVSAVIGFYRWLEEEHYFVPAHSPWVESDAHIPLTDRKGFRRYKKVKTTDLRVHVPKQDDPYAGAIADGGKLRPLPMEEQIMLLDALKKLGNIEMTLIHLLALFTGARIQTVLTFRVRHARLVLPKKEVEVALPVGHGTMIDTKYGKRGTLFMPRWLYEKLCIYSHSDRAHTRRVKAGSDDENQYLFLSNRGAPLYRSKEDRDEFDETLDIRHEKVGQTVRQYIKDMVLPTIKAMTGKTMHYQLHDLRATFGMNLTDMQLALVESGKATLHEVREFVKFRMMHESAATTDLYLQFRGHQKLVRRVQEQYELYLQSLADRAQGILS
jgi:hypothetical protein